MQQTDSSLSPALAPIAPAPPGRRLHVLQVASTLHIGGAEEVIASLSENLDRSRFEVTTCYLKENGVVGERMRGKGVDLVPVPGFVAGRRDRWTSLKLAQLIRNRAIDVIHTHDLHGFMDGAVCRLRDRELKFVHTFHFGNYPHRETKYRWVERALWRVPDMLVAVGHAQSHSIRSLYGIPERRMRVLWNGVEPKSATVSDEIRAAIAGARGPVIASISTLIPQKGLHHLLDAAHRLQRDGREFLLLVVGDGKLRGDLSAQAARLGLGERVRFLGWVPEAARRVLPACDVFVQSSLWEAMSVAVLEAMAASKPVVVTTAGDNAHVVENERTGLTVPIGDAGALAAALTRLIDTPALRAELGERARQRFLEEFTVAHMVRRYEQLFSELCTNRVRLTA